MLKVFLHCLPVHRFRCPRHNTLVQRDEGMVSCQLGPAHFHHGLGALLLRALCTDGAAANAVLCPTHTTIAIAVLGTCRIKMTFRIDDLYPQNQIR
jgi:hypothetical protein